MGRALASAPRAAPAVAMIPSQYAPTGGRAHLTRTPQDQIDTLTTRADAQAAWLAQLEARIVILERRARRGDRLPALLTQLRQACGRWWDTLRRYLHA